MSTPIEQGYLVRVRKRQVGTNLEQPKVSLSCIPQLSVLIDTLSGGTLNKVLLWTLYACLATSGLNLLLITFSLGSSSQVGLSPQSTVGLRRPSVYYGLDTVPRNMSEVLHPLQTWPSLLAQISVASPTKVFPQDSARYMSTEGTVSPEERHLLLTNEVCIRP